MSDESAEPDVPTDRESPVGQPVIRGDPEATGEHADRAVEFDPNDEESLEAAAITVRAFVENTVGDEDSVYMLRGAAACAALVRGVGSYKAAAERAGGETTVSFIRKWARVHDLPRAIRRHVAKGEIAPTAAKHIARVSGTSRFLLAFAILDHGLTVREVRSLASEIADGTDPAVALGEAGYPLGELTIRLPVDAYCKLRRRASLEDEALGSLIATALAEHYDAVEEPDRRQP
ncbi:hypothetical protein HLRTI_003061 [Halorhabdus tiamatea SARL4B]|uniref:DUF7119 domain-containing protein n=1 Tax=Halorhabdus tiamatea SARL4B TaxID=1033806 RepID=F7PGD8_9EURY|nr:hypothetical protein [Halorhabdus tiamatea]ERJ04948.1 hypothetical protein HLRTI_003061 [Halorhabdus tiamatea SARL4B]CCQ33827.1 conserved hypothetical protein [Halorhabdus tiamatea SARL4B]